jgi:methyl-accepting chemotaxis protein
VSRHGGRHPGPALVDLISRGSGLARRSQWRILEGDIAMDGEEKGSVAEVTVSILRGIRDGVRQTNERIDQASARIDETNLRLDKTNASIGELREELSRRIVASEIRTSTAITDLAGNVRELTEVLRQQYDLRPRVEQCERDIAELKRTTRAT